ncbi:sensor histidine kinase [Nocardiopsis lambiniae]|uniref:histidine kinase n=1 Tax=Nocardiopsis lambiniae TaxID=3075539 RepID=A0ABU2M7K8_9ACTN|nr:sensor domain-containing protein [Nocardiopsis sp. DSM 44743]MDT0328654.1 sensor domain-containing protein [Nocardiopsis sp. DSM 44743]
MRPTDDDTGLFRELVRTGLNNMFLSLERLAGGLITAVMALFSLAVIGAVLLASLAGVGLLLLPAALRLLRAVADRERHRLSRWGWSAPSPPPATDRATVSGALRALVGDVQVRRDLCWLVCHSTLGFLTGVLGVLLPVIAVRDATFPLWWRLLPPDTAGASIGVPVHDWYTAAAVGLLGVAWAAIAFGAEPALARLQAWPGHRLLGPHSRAVLYERITELTATRAAALRSHTTELRRIERSLHDGAQSRLVAVIIQVGAARRVLRTDPARVDAALERAQAAAEDALAELRGLVRGILPPILESHDLEGALGALAAGCSVPCTVEVGDVAPLASSIEATVYFTVAEAVTNVTRHSGARRARVRVVREGDTLYVHVHDDGRGGAAEHAGSGLTGIRRRVEAHDGSLTVHSPEGGPTDVRAELPCGS